MRQKGIAPVFAILIIGIIFGSIYLATKIKWANLSVLVTPQSDTQNSILKTYKSDIYHYSIEYPNNANVFAPILRERELLDEGKIKEGELSVVQFRTNDGSFLFTVSKIDNPQNLPIKQFLINGCAQAEKEGDSCPPNIKYENYKMPNGTIGLIASTEWYAEAIKKDSLQRTFYYSLDKKIISISFNTINLGDTKEVELENTIINSFKILE